MKKAKCKKTLDDILYICFEEEHQELTKELVSIQNTVAEDVEDNDCISVIETVLDSIYLYAEEFDNTVYEQVEEMYRDLVEN